MVIVNTDPDNDWLVLVPSEGVIVHVYIFLCDETNEKALIELNGI
jgi:hypothetical protein